MKALLTLLFFTMATYANIGTIMALTGKADVIRDTKTLKASSGMDLQQGDEIVTQLKTKVQVLLNDDTAITIGPKSSFSFVDYLYDGSKNSRLTMQSTRGFFRSVTGKIGKLAPERFKVKTNIATIGVRGTDFSALLRDQNEFFKCHSGEITVSFQDKIKSVSAGEELQLQLDGGKVKEKAKSSKSNASNANQSPTFGSVNIEDITEKTQDIQDVKFDCQTK